MPWREKKLEFLLKDKIPQKRKYPEQRIDFKSFSKAQKMSSVETEPNYKSVNYHQSLHNAPKHGYKHNHNRKIYHSTKH